MTSDTEFIPISTIFNETCLAMPLDGLESEVPCQPEHHWWATWREFGCLHLFSYPEQVTVSVWHGNRSLEWTEQEEFVMCVIWMQYSTRTRFQPNQSSASTTDNPQRNRASLLSLAIVHLGLEALIACDYHFLWRFCHVWESAGAWWGSPLGDAICQFLSWEMSRDLMGLGRNI